MSNKILINATRHGIREMASAKKAMLGLAVDCLSIDDKKTLEPIEKALKDLKETLEIYENVKNGKVIVDVK